MPTRFCDKKKFATVHGAEMAPYIELYQGERGGAPSSKRVFRQTHAKTS
ncbi:MAG: hypothetical protein ACJARR_002380 [Pseudophaeobacter arcticus]|jgi:hypothetical protein